MSFDDRLRQRMSQLRGGADVDSALAAVPRRAARLATRRRTAAGATALAVLLSAVAVLARPGDPDPHERLAASPIPASTPSPSSELPECQPAEVEGSIRTNKSRYELGEEVVVVAEVVNRSGGDCAPLLEREFAIVGERSSLFGFSPEMRGCPDAPCPWKDGETVALEYRWNQVRWQRAAFDDPEHAPPGRYTATVTLTPWGDGRGMADSGSRLPASAITLSAVFTIAEGAEPTPEPGPTPEPTPESYPECEPAEVSRTTATDKQRYGPGEDVLIIGEATNAGSRSCRFPGGHVVGIYDEEGTHLGGMAVSGSCLAPCGPWEPGATMRSTATWGQQLSGDDPGSAPPGRYRASMTYAEITQDVWFEIEASGSPAPSGNGAGS